jgi:hypothetical protein
VVDAISVTPSSGAGTTQLFVLAYADSGGVATDLTSARVRFAGAAGGPCVIDYNAMTNRVRMQNNAGAWKPFVPFGSGTLGNRQCTLDLAASSATRSGTDLTLMLQIAFSATFAGEKNIAMRAASHAGPTTGWMDRGTWTVPSASSTISVRGRGPSLNPATFELSDPSHGR